MTINRLLVITVIILSFSFYWLLKPINIQYTQPILVIASRSEL